MKKYFVKFLPAEGEITPGEIYRSKWRTENMFYHFSVCKKIEDGKIFPTEGVGSECGFDLSDGIKVKPFLLERETLEVIGEVSDKAHWIQPGEEFDEYRQSSYCEKGSECDINFGGQNCSAPHLLKSKVYLKGPCGHFH